MFSGNLMQVTTEHIINNFKHMEILGTVIVVIIGIIVILTIINQFITRKIKTNIVINASKEKVWDVLMDHKNYSEWNPFIPKISVIGENLDRISMVILDNNGEVLIPEKGALIPEGYVLSNIKYKKFSWGMKGSITLLVNSVHYYELESISNEQTKFIHGETVSGVFSGIVAYMLRQKAGNQYEALNKALKTRVE